MLFLRTAAGGFVNAATIVRLCEETDGDDMLLAGWVRRRQGRLCATAAIAPAPRPKRNLIDPPDAIDETAKRMSETITQLGGVRQ